MTQSVNHQWSRLDSFSLQQNVKLKPLYIDISEKRIMQWVPLKPETFNANSMSIYNSLSFGAF